jgi:hypothetical protein
MSPASSAHRFENDQERPGQAAGSVRSAISVEAGAPRPTVQTGDPRLGTPSVQVPEPAPFTAGRHLIGVTDQPDFNLTRWPDLEVNGLDQTNLDIYLKRKSGICLFIEGANNEKIREASGVGIRWIGHLVRRCMIIHPDGRIYGWRALIRYDRISPYIRKKKVKPDQFGRGCAGSMQSLLLIEPEFEQRFRKWILKPVPPGKLGEINKSVRRIWEWFLDELRKLGYEVRNEWPFSTKSMGYSAVARYAKQVLLSDPAKAAYLAGGKSLADKLKAGDGVDRPVRRPYQRVEMDAHSLNGIFCILVPHPLGGHAPKIVRRLWVVVILDVYSRAVLGYYLSMNPEVNKQDVLRAIKSALTFWEPSELSMGNVRYADEAALPSGHQERYIGLCWDETSVDGALAETCKTVKDALRNVVGSVLVDPSRGFAARRLKDDRPFIESFFRTLGVRSLNRMTNSTGSKPSDKKGRDPAQVAIASQFQLEYLEDLLDVLIANYNATEHAGLGYRSPLQALDFATTRDDAPPIRRADPRLVSGLLSVTKMCIVKGGYREGRRPYVNFGGASYSGEILIGRHDLVGTKIAVTNHLEDDARFVKAATTNGHSLGLLRAAAPWNGLPHSLEIRKAVQALLNDKRFRVASGEDPIAAFMNYAESSPGHKLSPHSAYLEMRRIMAAVARRGEDANPVIHAALARVRLDEERESRAEANDAGPGVAPPALAAGRRQRTAATWPSAPKSLPMHRMAASK